MFIALGDPLGNFLGLILKFSWWLVAHSHIPISVAHAVSFSFPTDQLVLWIDREYLKVLSLEDLPGGLTFMWSVEAERKLCNIAAVQTRLRKHRIGQDIS